MKRFLPLLLILPLLLWVSCEDNGNDSGDNNGTSNLPQLDPVNLHVQDKIYTHHLRIHWDRSDSANILYKVIMANDSLFTNGVIQTTSNDTMAIFERLYQDGLIVSDDGEGWKYFVKVVVGDSVESNVEVYQISRSAGIVYIPYDAYDANEAFNAISNSDTIIFPEGVHTHNGNAGGTNIVLIGDGIAENVILEGRLDGCGVSLFNLTMTNGGETTIRGHGTGQDHFSATNVIFNNATDDYPIYFSAHKTAVFKNCIFYNNSPKNVIFTQNVTFENCTFHNVTNPISLNPEGDPNNPTNDPVVIINCLFTSISGDVINYINFPSTQGDFVNVSYSGFDNSSQQVSGDGNITSSPYYTDPNNADFHLSSPSGFIDAGNPDPQYNDVDGTRNDMGAYGGPNGGW